jgi:hypothetical protein
MAGQLPWKAACEREADGTNQNVVAEGNSPGFHKCVRLAIADFAHCGVELLCT